jgi:ABC-type nitrate/sulfonate/bicarbonate transport system substrate-binding protein
VKRYMYALIGATAVSSSLVACGSDEGSTSSDDAIRAAYAGDLDPNDIADQFGLEAAGADVTHLTENSGVVAGLNKDQFDIANIDVTDAIKAITGGVPLKIVYVSQDLPEFVMVSQPEITDIAGLEGKTFAYHSPGSLTEILPRELVRQTDPALEDKIKWSVLPESPNRASAMVAERIDATALEFLDVITLQEQGDFNIIGSWDELTGTSADAMATVWVTTDSYLEDNRDKVADFLTKVQEGYDQVYEDEAAWQAKAEELLPDADPETLKKAYDYYTGVDMYPHSGTSPLTEERWEAMDTFFRQIGEYEETAPLDIVDFELANEISGQ